MALSPDPQVAGWRVGADIGGTFTDVIALGPDGEVVPIKVLVHSPGLRLGRRVGDDRRTLVGRGPARQAVVGMLHGTTVATNAILSMNGVRTAVVTTLGFRDVLEIGRLRRPTLYDLSWTKLEPLALCLEIATRSTSGSPPTDVVAKVNLSEFASGGAFSSLGGQTRNPHDPARTPSGSSGGSGVAVAAGYAPLGLGTDTGGSVRGPSSSNGIVGLKPTHGLLSRDGIIPLALSFDTGGPMARSVADIAVALGVMTGVDPADAATKKSEGRFERDYTKYLNADALKGARIGIARDFMGQDAEVDWVVEASLQALRAAGATVVDVRFPKWLLDAKGEFYTAVRYPEFPVQIAAYLATLKPGFPRTLAEMIEKSDRISAMRADGAGPNPPRWTLFKREASSGPIDSYRYTAVRDHGLPLVRSTVEGVLSSSNLDAMVYPTSSRRPAFISAPPDAPGGDGATGSNLANLSGFPDLIVPAGFTSDRLPVSISFVGPAFSEAKLIGLGYAFEQATKARRRPVHTPGLPGESIAVK